MCQRLRNSVRVLCPLIEDRIRARSTNYWREYDLRKELIGCILGSQVRHEMAVAATANLEQAGLLDDDWWSGDRGDGFESNVFLVLSGRRHNLHCRSHYRFPKARASQLAQARCILAKGSLTARLENDQDPKRTRQCLIEDIPGLGPKQASMFLRNIGKSYDLAILDTHVLRFMDMQDILPIEKARIGTVAGYERAERILVDYADTLGYPAGYLDWAIWATMKAARELGL
jgi:N-glycosylase/DNA lyase